MRRGRCRLNVADALVLTLDPFVRDQRLESRDRRAGRFEELPGADRSVAPDECGGIEPEARQHLTRVARAGARPDLLAFEHEHVRARARQRSRR